MPQAPDGSAAAPAPGDAITDSPTPAGAEIDPDDEEPGAAEPGVEVEVTPAGKSMKRLSLLSGGEKSLVALAFLFAVFLAKPCPFYVLDEVEAALDDVNIDRFLQLVRRFSDRAQFIIVTHQKRTMDAADCLYGVSMGGDGVSKVISRRMPPEAASGIAPARRADRLRSGRLTRPTGRVRILGADMARTWRELFITRTEAPPPPPEPEEEKRGFFSRLRENMSKSRQALGAELQASVFQTLDDETWERLEETLIYADVGASTTAKIVERLETEAGAGELSGGEDLTRRLQELLAEAAAHGRRHDRPAPRADGDPDGRRQRHGQDDDDRQDRLAPVEGAGPVGAAGGRRHLPRRRCRAARALGRARRHATSSAPTPGSDPGAVAFDAIQAGEGARPRRRDHRHGRAGCTRRTT